MSVFLNGFKIKRSSSPVIMHEAGQAAATSKNLLSLGSRQSLIISSGVINSISDWMICKICSFLILERKWSNLGRCYTSN